MSTKIRGFEIVEDKFRKFPDVDVKLPQRGTSQAMAYDFYSNETITILPGEQYMFATDIKAYMQEGTLKVELLGRGMAWLDTGTHSSMLQASNFVEAVQSTQGTFIACLEEIAFRQGWITSDKVLELAEPLKKTGYGQYLIDIVNESKENR